MPLTDTKIRTAKPKDKEYKLYDTKGLCIIITPSGGKWWRFNYSYGGKRKTISLGTYPEVSLKEARERRDEARRLLARGINPSEHRKKEKQKLLERQANTFEKIALEWFNSRKNSWSESHASRVYGRLERFILPFLKGKPIAEITPQEILEVIKPIEARNTIETARRVLQIIGQIFRYAVSIGKADYDPTYSLKGIIPPPEVKHMPAPTDPQVIGGILRALDAFGGTFVVRCIIRLLPLVFVRPGELRTMKWQDVDLEAAEWRFILSKTKTEHIVPLSRQALEILHEIHPVTSHYPSGWVFPSIQSPDRPLSDMTINAAYKRLGIDTKRELTAHGWRAIARTLLHEKLGYPPEVIEHQLGHKVPDMLGNAYNRTRFLEQRREMMQRWADYLDHLKAGRPFL